MGQPRQDRQFVNGAFIKRVWVDKNDSSNELFNVGLKKKDFIAEIEKLEEDERGFVNLSMGSQKADRDKFSLWEKEPMTQSSNRSSKSSSTSTASQAKQEEPAVADDTDDLPF